MSVVGCGLCGAATLSLTALTNMGADIDYIAAYSGVNYVTLMTNADLVVEGTSVGSPGWGMPLSFRVLNDPILIGQERYLLWLRHVRISDTNVLRALVRTGWPTNAFYEAVIRSKGAIQLTWNNTNHYARMQEMFTKMDNEMRERCEAWNRRCERDYFMMGFGTSNRAAIVEATTLFARGMLRGTSRIAARAQAAAALRVLGGAANTNLADMAEMHWFNAVDFVP